MTNSGQLSELDEFRRQVADLSRELAEWDRVLHEQQRPLDPEILELRRRDETLRAIIKGIEAASGHDLFRVMVRHLAEALNVRYAFVGEWNQDRPNHVRTIVHRSGYALRPSPSRSLCVLERRGFRRWQ